MKIRDYLTIHCPQCGDAVSVPLSVNKVEMRSKDMMVSLSVEFVEHECGVRA